MSRKRRRESRRVSLLLGLLVVCALVAGVRLMREPALPGAEVTLPEWVEKDYLSKNPYSRPGEPLREINGVVIHYVGNPGTSARANRSYFEGLAAGADGVYASAHFIVGLEGEILQCIPLTEISYASNTRNGDTIAIEVCHPDAGGEFSPETRESVVRLTAWLCERFDLEGEAVIRHYDVSGKLCPLYYVEHEEAWAALLQAVEEKRAEA